MSLPLIIHKIRFPAVPITTAITVSLYIKGYYAPDSAYTLIGSNIPVDVNGNILDSPLPETIIDPTLKYVLKAVNELCGDVYSQGVIINPYCPTGYSLTADSSLCVKEDFVDATPPSGGENTVAKTQDVYASCGSYIYDAGYNINGTGTSARINVANAFWINGPGDCSNHTITDGPLNRCGLWATTTMDNQTVGFAVCIDLPETKTYYIGMGSDNLGIVKLDGVEIIHQDPTALGIQYGVGPSATFKVWHIYPVQMAAGSHIIEIIGLNDTGVAAMGCEIYNNTSTEIAAATDYTGLNLVFSSKDYIGQPVQLGSDNLGYSCPSGYSLSTCSSPFVCRRLVTTNVLY